MESIKLLSEPELEFGFGKKMTDPHAGLSLFGPFDSDDSTHPSSISYVLIGTNNGVEKFKRFVNKIQKPIISCKYEEAGQESKDVRLWPPFPGFESAFSCKLPLNASKVEFIDNSHISKFLMRTDSHERVFQITDLYLEAIRRAYERGRNGDVTLLFLPGSEIIYL